MLHRMPLLHSRTQRKCKDFSSDVSPSAVLMRHQMQNIFWKILMVVVVAGPSLNKALGVKSLCLSCEKKKKPPYLANFSRF